MSGLVKSRKQMEKVGRGREAGKEGFVGTNADTLSPPGQPHVGSSSPPRKHEVVHHDPREDLRQDGDDDVPDGTADAEQGLAVRQCKEQDGSPSGNERQVIAVVLKRRQKRSGWFDRLGPDEQGQIYEVEDDEQRHEEEKPQHRDCIVLVPNERVRAHCAPLSVFC